LRVADDPIQRLLGFRLLLLETQLGRLDVLREVSPLGEYESLATVELPVGTRRYKVMSLDALLAVKRSLRRPKDIEVAAELEAIKSRQADDD
jgi:hypothetical protein